MEERPHYLFPEWAMFLFVLGILCLSIFLYIIKPALREKKKRIFRYRHPGRDPITREMQYDSWLQRYNSYYASLSPSLKKRFLKRTIDFLESKEFRFHSMVEEEYIPVLISGAAVQITFGLPSYRMDYYQTIHVIRKEYTLHIDKETYYGHVSRSGIYISWKRFLEGYDNYNDADNIGLHEMAHALSFDSLLGNEDDADRLFKERIRPFYKEGTVLFRRMKKGYSTILEDYAASNFDEFWTVSVEHFFENGASLRSNHPDLYNSIAFLLNQDPLSSELIRDPVLAGLAN